MECLLFFGIVCGIFDVPNKCCETVTALADTITKAALSPQLLKDPACWSGRGLEPVTFHAVVPLAINLAKRSAVGTSV